MIVCSRLEHPCGICISYRSAALSAKPDQSERLVGLASFVAVNLYVSKPQTPMTQEPSLGKLLKIRARHFSLKRVGESRVEVGQGWVCHAETERKEPSRANILPLFVTLRIDELHRSTLLATSVKHPPLEHQLEMIPTLPRDPQLTIPNS